MMDILPAPLKKTAEKSISDISIAIVSILEPNVFLVGVGK